MNTLEKLERLLNERYGNLDCLGGQYHLSWNTHKHNGLVRDTITEAIEEAYEAAFRAKDLEVGDIFEASQQGRKIFARYIGHEKYCDFGFKGGEFAFVRSLDANSIRVIGKACEPYEATV